MFLGLFVEKNEKDRSVSYYDVCKISVIVENIIGVKLVVFIKENVKKGFYIFRVDL